MKKAIALIIACSALMLCASPAKAQLGLPGTVSLGTNLVAQSTTTTGTGSNLIIPCANFNNVAIGISAKMGGASTDTNVFKFAASVDGSVFETTPSITVNVTMNGTNNVIVAANQAVGAFRALKLISAQNACTNQTMTINSITYSLK